MAAITVLMPVRDFHPQFLREAADSILAQTSGEWRLLVVTEPGSDTAVAGALGDATGDPRIEILTTEGRRLAGAVNTGMRAASTAFVGILLGDDLWEPDAVEILAAHAQSLPEVDFFHSARRIVDDQGRPISSVYPARPQVELADFRRGPVVRHLLCWRRELGLAVGGLDETLPSTGSDDWDFPWTMAEHGARFHAIQTCLYVYRDHRSGYRLTTHQTTRTFVRGIRRILRKHGVGRLAAFQALRRHRRGHLRQCLYHSRLDRLVRTTLGLGPRAFRTTYE